ncbi:MAG TPA: Gfo/Idh/MocA family oxidoreductase [Mycobacteriales bacterium]|nr:Gfo/Idh/MocA family oxidoreductase [Mycobacteriales bacterium]
MGSRKVGVLGAGGMGREHSGAWRTLGIPVTIYSRTESARQALAEQTGAAAAESLDALLSEVDIVDICTPTDTHAPLARAAAAAGRHVICEKPLARTIADAVDVIDTCEKAGVQLHVGQVVRYFPEYVATKAAVDAGELGKPAVLRLSRSVNWPSWGGTWFLDLERSGGMLVDLMIHDYDFARWIAGEVRRVYARTVTKDGGGYGRSYAILTHAGGAATHAQGEWSLPGNAFRSTLEVAGDAGLIQFDSADNRSFRSSAPLPDLPLQPFADQLAEFLAAIEGGPPPRVGPADALAALRIALAAEESGRTGQVVEVPA